MNVSLSLVKSERGNFAKAFAANLTFVALFWLWQLVEAGEVEIELLKRDFGRNRAQSTCH